MYQKLIFKAEKRKELRRQRNTYTALQLQSTSTLDVTAMVLVIIFQIVVHINRSGHIFREREIYQTILVRI